MIRLNLTNTTHTHTHTPTQLWIFTLTRYFCNWLSSRGSRHLNLGAGLALSGPWLSSLLIIWQPLLPSFIPPLFLSSCLRPAVCDSPHVKTDLVAGRKLALCVCASSANSSRVMAVAWLIGLHIYPTLASAWALFAPAADCWSTFLHVFSLLKNWFKCWRMQDFAQACMYCMYMCVSVCVWLRGWARLSVTHPIIY